MKAQTVEHPVEATSQNARFVFHHIPELDGFRGVAVLVVVIGHYLEFRLPHRNPYFATLDKLGVLLFFVLSGFLITGLLQRERALTGAISFRGFYLRRVLRLAPAFLLFLGTMVVLMRLGWITDVPQREILECVLYARNIFGHSLSLGHIWSLSLEEQFYLLWPLAFSLLPLKRSPLLVIGICAAFIIWRGAAVASHLFSYEAGIYYMRPYFRFDSILIGACLVLWLSSSSAATTIMSKLLAKTPSLLLWAPLFFWTLLGEALTRAWYLSIQEVMVAAVLAQVVLCKDDVLGRLFRFPALRYCGTISYSVYLWQQIFLVTSLPSWGPLRTLPLSLLCPFAIAACSYNFIEKPLLRLKERWAPQAS